jgi:hypothetical protein
MKCSFLSFLGPTTYCINYLLKRIMLCLKILPGEPVVCIKGGTHVSTSRKCFMVNKFKKEGDLKAFKRASTRFGSKCPFGVKYNDILVHKGHVDVQMLESTNFGHQS